MAINKKETSTEVKKEKKKKTTKKPVELKGKTNTRTITSKRPKVAPAPQKPLLDVYKIAKTVLDGMDDKQFIANMPNVDDLNSNYVRVGDWEIPLTGGTVTSISTNNTGATTYIDGSMLGNLSPNTTITDVEKNPYTNPEFPNMWGGGQVAYIAPVETKEDKLLTFLNSIESELIEINSKLSINENNYINNIDNLSYHELFEIKKHLSDTIGRHHYPGSTGNIYMMQAQRRYEIIEGEINNKLNILFGDV
jgi:hypothetical protein